MKPLYIGVRSVTLTPIEWDGGFVIKYPKRFLIKIASCISTCTEKTSLFGNWSPLPYMHQYMILLCRSGYLMQFLANKTFHTWPWLCSWQWKHEHFCISRCFISFITKDLSFGNVPLKESVGWVKAGDQVAKNVFARNSMTFPDLHRELLYMLV